MDESRVADIIRRDFSGGVGRGDEERADGDGVGIGVGDYFGIFRIRIRRAVMTAWARVDGVHEFALGDVHECGPDWAGRR